MKDLNGLLVVDKPRGWTSHDVVNKTRFMLGVKKAGHTGTLDPMATGVLVLLIGRATKLATLFENDNKRYLAEVTFGSSTDTHDAEGVVVKTGDPSVITLSSLTTAIDSFKGVITQLPPMYSAVKVGGKKLYQIARKGGTVERKPRNVTIFSLEAVLDEYPVITLDVVCTKGTYIRSLANDIGEKAGCPAHLSALRRTAAGQFTIDSALDFQAIVNDNLRDELEKGIQPLSDFGIQ